jgi:hypothetical protein
MKLLAKKEARTRIAKSNEALFDNVLRLRQVEKDLLHRLNTAKTNYDPEKVKALKDFEQFVSELNQKKSALLKDLNAYEKLIEDRKEIYYGLIEKQDLLEEKRHQVEEAHRKLDLRESFIVDLERRIREKQL